MEVGCVLLAIHLPCVTLYHTCCKLQVLAWGSNEEGETTVPDIAKRDVIAISAGAMYVNRSHKLLNTLNACTGHNQCEAGILG
jgi:hypothetical protein